MRVIPIPVRALASTGESENFSLSGTSFFRLVDSIAFGPSLLSKLHFSVTGGHCAFLPRQQSDCDRHRCDGQEKVDVVAVVTVLVDF
jgi:hypothetical protein